MMKYYLFMLSAILLFSCKEKYISDTVMETRFLVVEGNINNGNDSTIIQLSRSEQLNSIITTPESNAKITIESIDGNVNIPLLEKAKGSYSIYGLNLNSNTPYRVRIITSNNQTYLSDTLRVLDNPAIDSVNWINKDNGVQLYVNTHTNATGTNYYKWDYKETFEFHSKYKSYLKISTVNYYKAQFAWLGYRDSVNVTFDNNMFQCWKDVKSSDINISNTANLNTNSIHFPLTWIEPNAEKLSIMYSILVNQYAISKEAYNFYNKIKKNTENTGTLFDPQPSEINGNIHNTKNPSEIVIGFMNICNPQSKRIFIDNKSLNNWTPSSQCYLREIKNNSDSILLSGRGLIPTDVAQYVTSIVSYYAAPPECVDCRTKGGNNNKPTYWPK